eukprot:844074-Prorocentrum_minimum.AAC.3
MVSLEILEEIEEPTPDSTQQASSSPNVEEFEDAHSDLSDKNGAEGQPDEATGEENRLRTQDGVELAEDQSDLGFNTTGDELQVEREEDTRPYEERVREAEALKAEGNQLYSSGEFDKAENSDGLVMHGLLHCEQEKYTQAIVAAPEDEPKRAVYIANRAACRLQNVSITGELASVLLDRSPLHPN